MMLLKILTNVIARTARPVPCRILLAVPIALIVCGATKASSAFDAPKRAAELRQRALVAAALLPMQFEVNRGQTDSQVQFVSRGRGYTVFLSEGNAMVELQNSEAAPVMLSLKLFGGRLNPQGNGIEEQPGKSNYLVGNEQANWITGIRSYRGVRYRDVYAGVDLFYHGRERQLEYDFIVNPGSDPRIIGMEFEGAKPGLGADGSLVLTAPDVEMRLSRPVFYQDIDGRRTEIPGAYALDADGRVRFAVGNYDSTKTLVIDPVLSYSTYLGGRARETGPMKIDVDAGGNVYIAGTTPSIDFPLLRPFKSACGPACADAFVVKLSPSGSLVYSTYLGGSGTDLGLDISVSSTGSVYLTGQTQSRDFPTMNPMQGSLLGDADAFVTQLNPEGAALAYSTYFGGRLNDVGTGIAVDARGNVFFAGTTTSPDLPTKNAFQGRFNGGQTDAFLARLNPEGTALIFSSYLGGFGAEQTNDLSVDRFGDAYIVGNTTPVSLPATNPGGRPQYQTPHFPVVNAVQKNPGGGTDAFIVKVNAAGAVQYATLLGGATTDQGNGVAIDASGAAYLVGVTRSSDFPLAGGVQKTGGRTALRKTVDGGETWEDIGTEPYLRHMIQAIAIDPTKPSTLYADGSLGPLGDCGFGTYQGFGKSTNGGKSFPSGGAGIPQGSVASLVIDPSNTSIVYAGHEGGGVFKTTDGGQKWTAMNTGLAGGNVRVLALDPTNPAIIYAVAGRFQAVAGPSGGIGTSGIVTGYRVYKSADAARTWTPQQVFGDVAALAIDPKNSNIIYAGTSQGVFKTINGGQNWLPSTSGLGQRNVTTLAIDPSNPARVFASASEGSVSAIFRSVDSGTSWAPVKLEAIGRQTAFLAINPKNPSLIYAVWSGGAGAFKSTNGGESWTALNSGLEHRQVFSLAMDPVNPAILYAGNRCRIAEEGFVAKLDPKGSSLVYSRYFGGSGQDYILAAAVDAGGNLAITGWTNSNDFPLLNPIQPLKKGIADVFLARLSPAGSSILFSTFLGGNGPNGDSGYDQSTGIALDAASNVYLSGFTESLDFPTVSAFQPANRGGIDAFVLKIAP